MKYAKAGCFLSGCLSMSSLLCSQGTKQDVDWPVMNGGPAGSHYSALKQINASNVSRLKVAWTYDAGDVQGTIETNPIEVNGVVYGYTAGQRVFAINATTGKEIWKFDSGGPGRGNNRGLSYWHGGPDERIFAGVREFVYSLDAKTGKPDPNFGLTMRGRANSAGSSIRYRSRASSGTTHGRRMPGLIWRAAYPGWA